MSMKLFLRMYYAVSLLVLTDHVLFYTNQVSLAGYSSDVILFWCWFILTGIVVLYYIKKLWIPLLIFIVFSVIAFIPLMFYIGAVLPFAFGRIICEHPIDNQYRLQTERKFLLAQPRIHLVKEFAFFLERDFGPPAEYEQSREIIEADSTALTDPQYEYTELCRVKEARLLQADSHNTIIVEIKFEESSSVLTFEKQ